MKILMVGNLYDEHSKLKILMNDSPEISLFLSDGLYNLNLNDFEIIICESKIYEIMNKKYKGEIIYLYSSYPDGEFNQFPNKTKQIQLIPKNLGILGLCLEIYIKLLNSLSYELKKYKKGHLSSDQFFNELDLKILKFFLNSNFQTFMMEDIKTALGSPHISDKDIQDSVIKINDSNQMNGVINIRAFGYEFKPYKLATDKTMM